MGRLKKDHTGYRTSGLWLKYEPVPTHIKLKSKKDTVKWCRGKIGKEHDWHRFQVPEWSDKLWGYTPTYVAIRCIKCDKQKYAKTAKAANYPLHIWVDIK